MIERSDDLLKALKRSLGVLEDDHSLDTFYKEQLDIAYADLISDDISERSLQSPIGHTTCVLYAQDLIKGLNIATDNHLIFLRNKLSANTKGERFMEDDCDKWCQ